jgi:dihydrofolate reductase
VRLNNERDRKIIVYIATSADRYTARTDGPVDWLNRPRPAGNQGMAEFLRSIDMILWGRKTYDQVRTRAESIGFGPKIKNHIFSHRPPGSPVPKNIEFVNEPSTPSRKVFAQCQAEISG